MRSEQSAGDKWMDRQEGRWRISAPVEPYSDRIARYLRDPEHDSIELRWLGLGGVGGILDRLFQDARWRNCLVHDGL